MSPDPRWGNEFSECMTDFCSDPDANEQPAWSKFRAISGCSTTADTTHRAHTGSAAIMYEQIAGGHADSLPRGVDSPL